MPTDIPPFQVQNCRFNYSGQPCLDDISFTLERGRFYGLIGPNGSGKTTMIRLLAGLARPSSGGILLHGKPLQTYSRKQLAFALSLVPQNFSMGFEYTVADVVMMGRHPYIPRFARPTERDRAIVDKAISTLDIRHLRDRFVSRLSGGEKQRVLVARSLAQDTGIMLLDEATANLDIRHSIDIMTALRNRVELEGTIVLCAIHDLDLAAAFCDELLVMHKGSITRDGNVSKILTPHLLRDVFGVEATVHHTEGRNAHVQYSYHTT